MLIKLTVPGSSVNADVLGRALEAATAIAETQVEQLPPLLDLIQSGRVVWKPEPKGQGYEAFDMPADVMRRGHGDCDDLAPWWAAHLRLTGEDEGANAIVYPSGPNRWHAVVERSDGSIDDPSRWAGMGASQAGTKPPIEPPLVVGDDGASENAMQVIAMPKQGCFVCRIDLSCSHCEPTGLSVRAADASVLGAIEKAANNAFHVAITAGLSQDTIDSVWALLAALRGEALADIESVVGDVGPLIETVCNAALVGDGLLSTFFDPLGFHHMLDPVIDPLLAPQTTTRGGRTVTTQLNPAASDILHMLIGHGAHMGPYPPDYVPNAKRADDWINVVSGPGPRIGASRPIKWTPGGGGYSPAAHMKARAQYDKNQREKALALARAAAGGQPPPGSGITPASRAPGATPEGRAARAAAAAMAAQTPDWKRAHDPRTQAAAAARAAQQDDDGGDDDDDVHDATFDDDDGRYGDWDDGEA